jgi:hypothetical protein
MHVDALAANGYITEAMSLSERVVGQWADLPDVSRTVAAGVTGVAAAAHGDLPAARERLASALAIMEPRQANNGLPFLGIGYWTGMDVTTPAAAELAATMRKSLQEVFA